MESHRHRSASFKAKLKLWLKRRALMTLRAIVWHADEWIQAQEVKLREEIVALGQGRQRAGAVPSREDLESGPANCAFPDAPYIAKPAASGLQSARRAPEVRHAESFDAWTLRRAGVAPRTKQEAKRHRERLSAAAFDRRFAL